MSELDWKNLDPYDRVTFRGKQMNARDAAMHITAERKFGATVYITQGAFNISVGASGGTHAGGGALDWSTYGMSERQKTRWVRATKDTGWCSWMRRLSSSWPEHVHGIARGCKNSSPEAKAQVGAFDRREDGLIGDGMDYSYRPDPEVTFSYASFRRREIGRARLARLSDKAGSVKRRIKGLRRELLTIRREKERVRKEFGLS